MSDNSIPDVRAVVAEKKSPRVNSFMDHPLVQLTLVRFLEFTREPEALFWVFVFPVLLAAGLGIAFRNRPAEVLRIAAVTPDLAQSLRQEKLLEVLQLDQHAAQEALRTGKVALLAEPGEGGTVEYRYDDTNPEGRTARMLVDRQIQRAAGRVDPVATSDLLIREPGSRYIDFLIPGLLGMNLMGSAIWSMGFAIVDARRKKLLKRLIAKVPCPDPTICSHSSSRESCCWWWKWGCSSVSEHCSFTCPFEVRCWTSRSCVSSRRFLSALWDCCSPREPEPSKPLPVS